MLKKKKEKPPAPTPLQSDLDNITSRLTGSMRTGALEAIERVRTALDGSSEKAIASLKADAEGSALDVQQLTRERDNHRAQRETFETLAGQHLDVLKEIAGVLDGISHDAKKDELHDALLAIESITAINVLMKKHQTGQ